MKNAFFFRNRRPQDPPRILKIWYYGVDFVVGCGRVPTRPNIVNALNLHAGRNRPAYVYLRAWAKFLYGLARNRRLGRKAQHDARFKYFL